MVLWVCMTRCLYLCHECLNWMSCLIICSVWSQFNFLHSSLSPALVAIWDEYSACWSCSVHTYLRNASYVSQECVTRPPPQCMDGRIFYSSLCCCGGHPDPNAMTGKSSGLNPSSVSASLACLTNILVSEVPSLDQKNAREWAVDGHVLTNFHHWAYCRASYSNKHVCALSYLIALELLQVYSCHCLSLDTVDCNVAPC